MSILQYPNTISSSNAKVYNNATFDDASDDSATRASWAPLQPISINRPEPLESNSSKENRSPIFCPSPTLEKSQPPNKRNSQGKPLKLLFKQGLLSPPPTTHTKKIDAEIDEIEKEINRLSSRLEALRIEKGHCCSSKKADRRQSIGRIVPAKFMEPTQSTKTTTKKIEESPSALRRRGVSLGPSEIIRSRQNGKPEPTPSRRKSCFFRLPEIEEEDAKKMRKERGRSLSLSPKSRPLIRKIADPRRGVSTVGSKKPMKRDGPPVPTCLLEPKKLFNDGGANTCPSSKKSRVVPSRYGQIPDSDMGGKKTKRGALSGRGGTARSSRGRLDEEREKRVSWEERSETSISKMPESLPKIRTVRCESVSPRDSGPAKRVADLEGRKSHFAGDDDGMEMSVCTVLGFEEEE